MILKQTRRGFAYSTYVSAINCIRWWNRARIVSSWCKIVLRSYKQFTRTLKYTLDCRMFHVLPPAGMEHLSRVTQIYWVIQHNKSSRLKRSGERVLQKSLTTNKSSITSLCIYIWWMLHGRGIRELIYEAYMSSFFV